MVWRWAAASQIGTSHMRLGTRKQDAYRCFLGAGHTPAFCAIVCDGAGSAPYGGEGASLIARRLTIALRDHFQKTTALPIDNQVWAWIDEVRDVLAEVAKVRGTTRRAFASTLVLLVVAGDEALTAHVGDGAVVVRDATGDWRALSWPESGEYASTTYFVTDDPAPRLRLVRHRFDFDAVAVFSDGIENLALNFNADIPHEPFFRGMIAPIDGASGSGKMRGLSIALARFLDGPRVCGHTDDDKSMIIASTR